MITLNELNKLLDYNKDTGVFIWKVNRGGIARKGSVAGRLRKDGYIDISVNNRRYLAHKLAWMFVYGYYPTSDLDHINTINSDNYIVNLRETTHSKNHANVSKRENNTSGYKGVFKSSYKRWQASITVDGEQIYLGSYMTKIAAARAYDAAAKHYFGEYAKTNFQKIKDLGLQDTIGIGTQNISPKSTVPVA